MEQKGQDGVEEAKIGDKVTTSSSHQKDDPRNLLSNNEISTDDASAQIATTTSTPLSHEDLPRNPAPLPESRRFILYCNKEHVKKITIIVEAPEELVKQLDQVPHSDTLWETSILFPSGISPETMYSYKVTKSTVLKRSSYSEQFRLGEHYCHRDFLKNQDECVATHLTDIMLERHLLGPITDRCAEIERLVITAGNVQSTISTVAETIPKLPGTEKGLLFAVALGHMCKHCNMPLDNIQLLPDVCNTILDLLQQCSIDNLKASEQLYARDVYHALMKKSVENGNCVITVLNLGFPFLFQDKFNTLKILDYFKHHFKDVKTNEYLVNQSRSLIETISKMSTACQSIDGHESIKLFIENLDFSLAFAVYLEFQNPENTSKSFINIIRECLQERIKTIVLSVNSNESLSLLKYHWKSICQSDEERQKFEKEFQNAVIGFLDLNIKTAENCEKDIKDLVIQFKLFQGQESQVRLLMALSRIENEKISTLFIEILEFVATEDIYNKIEQNVFVQWFFSPAKLSNLQGICSRLARLFRIPGVSERKEMAEIGKNIISEALSRLKLQEIVKEITAIDKISSDLPLLGQMVIEVISERLQTHKEQESVLCSLIDDKSQVIFLRTRLQAEIVYMVMDKCGMFQEYSAEIGTFHSIIKNAKIWLMIFHVTGEPDHVNHVQSHENYQTVLKCLKYTFLIIKSEEVGYDFIKDVIGKEMPKRILSLVAYKDTIEEMLAALKTNYEQENSTIDHVLNVLETIDKKSSFLPPGFFSSLLDTISNMKDDLETGKINIKQCKEIWSNLQNIEKHCKNLAEVISSDAFWNVNPYLEQQASMKDNTAFNTTARVPRNETNEYQYTTCVGGDQNSDESSDTRKQEHTRSLLYVQHLHEVGLREYKKALNSLWEGTSVCMTEVKKIFGNEADVEKEEKISQRLFETPLSQNVWMALKKVYSIKDVDSNVSSMKKCLESFNVELRTGETLDSAFTEFNNLLAESFAECTFENVMTGMSAIFELVNSFSSETIAIISSIAHSRPLICFLKDVIHEDLRNLIDAAEDLSEEYVQAKTVSGLLEVSRYLMPFVTTDYTGRCNDLFVALETQTANFENVVNLPEKITDCMDNFHNLKSLYNNVANRGEQRKEVVKSIIVSGVFQYMFDERGSTLVVEVTYNQAENSQKSNNRTSKKDRSYLSDLRSRALLLKNTERDESDKRHLSRQELDLFIKYVDECFTLFDIILSLHCSGHVQFISAHREFKPEELEKNIEKLQKLRTEWLKSLREKRKEFYLLNFIHGPNLHLLYSYLEPLEKSSGLSKLENRESVEIFLQFLHPDMDIDNIQICYNEEKHKNKTLDDEAVLHCIGNALHQTFAKISKDKIRSKILCIETSEPGSHDARFKISDVVQEGKLLVAQLDEGSLYTVKTVIALYAHTGNQSLPESHQVLFCTRETAADELELLIERCLGETEFCKSHSLFCIANVEMLPGLLQFSLLENLKNIRERRTNFLLAIICRGSKSNPIIGELVQFLSTVTPVTDAVVKKVFDQECPNVVTVTSDLPGQGKTTFIKQTANFFKRNVKSLHISGSVQKLQVIERLRSLRLQKCDLLHIEICDIDNQTELDTFLFELITLKFVSCDKVCVCMNTSYVYLEIANTVNDRLRDKLQTAMLFKREHLTWRNFDNFAVSSEMQSPIQVVCHYLHYLKTGLLDKQDIMLLHSKTKPLPKSECRELLRHLFGNSRDMSFPSIITAVKVLASQLKKMTCSPFFRISRLKDMMGNTEEQNMKSSLVGAMIKSTKEFASRAVSACQNQQLSSVCSNTEQFSEKGKSENALILYKRVEGMISWESSNHLMFVFHSQNIQAITPIYSDILKVPESVIDLFERQMKEKLQDYRNTSQHDLQNILQKISRTDPRKLPSDKLMKIAKSYALTPDNLLKMVLIMLRIKANVPVIIMGETGCGKTSLLRYLAEICGMPFKTMNIHAGVSEEEIIQTVYESSKETYSKGETWLFFDEINTSTSVGLVSDIICHHKCLHKELSPKLVIIGACNPYKLRSQKAMCTAGLTEKLKTDEMSKLVYRVHPLPETVFDYVWDFGSLSMKDEKQYISRMVEGVFNNNSCYHELLTNVLSASQNFVRRKESSTYVVSLRDVHRCRKLTSWFLKMLQDLKPSPKTPYTCECNTGIRAIVLALAHCYHSRFSDRITRQEYRNMIRKHLDDKIGRNVDKSSDFIETIIQEEQIDFLSRMEVSAGIAKNEALMENVFIILVCIFNKIPIFVVGKPGCSKSLAIQVIRSNIRGKDSRDNFFCKLPQLYCVSYQGSESSTSDGIIKVFEKGEKYQMSNSVENVLSVVILDEIGLAEMSRFNPLKVLHSLLESEMDHGPNVAVVGISNWALDSSKMNRAIHLSRTDMDTKELYKTAQSISSSFSETIQVKTNQPRFLLGFEQDEQMNYLSGENIESILKNVVDAYCVYMKELRFPFKNFHGLRDFYALVKHIARACVKREHKIKLDVQKYLTEIVIGGLERNFSGLPDRREKLIQIFNDQFDFQNESRYRLLDLIVENVNDPIARHLMLITNGYSALGILENHLSSTGRKKAIVIFRSQFEDDLTDDYNYRILSKIILCMEEGVVLILKDLENIYGSLYDMLNQNYTIIGKKRNCRIALGAYSNPFCHVANSFRCIVLMDESMAMKSDPPFLNRFEKHCLRFSDIVTEEMTIVIHSLNCWLDDVRQISNRNFQFTDVLPIHSEDLLASLVWKMQSNSHQRNVNLKDCKKTLMMLFNPATIIRLKNTKSDEIRAQAEPLKREFFNLPLHDGLSKFLSFQLSPNSVDKNGFLTIIFTNSNVHSKLPRSVRDKNVGDGNVGDKNVGVENVEYENVRIEKLGVFKSEKHLTQRIDNFWFNSDTVDILMIQCSAVDDEKHILLTQSIVEQSRAEFLRENKGKTKHVFLIIHLDKSKGASKITSQINFLSEWNLVMLDSLECPKIPLKDFCEMTPSNAAEEIRKFKKYSSEELLWAFTRIKYGPYGRNIDSIEEYLKLMRNSDEFIKLLDDAISQNMSTLDTQHKDWQLNVACDTQALRNSATFTDTLEQCIMRIIKVSLAKLIYCMEKLGIVDSFFISSNTKNRRKSWEAVFKDVRFFCLNNIPDDAEQPECYVCNTDDLSLQMPFSRIIFYRIESTKDSFLAELSGKRMSINLEPGENLPVPMYKLMLEQHETSISDNIPDINQFFYEDSKKDYINDFCNILSMQIYPSMDRKKRTDYMKWIISQKTSLAFDNTLDLLVSLHTASWINSSLFRAELQLFGICEQVLTENDISDIMHLKFTEKILSSEKVEIDTAISLEIDDNQAKPISSAVPVTFEAAVGEDVNEKGKGMSGNKNKSYVSDKYVNIDAKAEGHKNNKAKHSIENNVAVSFDVRKEEDRNNMAKYVSVIRNQNESDVYNVSVSLEGTKEEVDDVGNENQSEPGVILECVSHDASTRKDGNYTADLFRSRIISETFACDLSSNLDIKSENMNNKATNLVSNENQSESSFSDVSSTFDAKAGEDGKDDTNDLIKNLNTSELNFSHEPVEEKCESKGRDEIPPDVLLSSEISTVCPENILIQHVCEKMLPTEETLNAYGGIDNWQRKVNTVLVLAARVSNTTKQLHSLRVCNDIASGIIKSQDKIKSQDNYSEWLEKIGTLLAHGHSLVSKKVFQSIFEILGTKESSFENHYTVLSSYLLRCIDYNSSTDVPEYLFEYILSGNLHENSVPFLKAPLSKLVDINEDEFLNLMWPEHDQPDDSDSYESFIDAGGRNKSKIEENGPSPRRKVFADQVKKVLKQLSQNEKKDSPVVLLFIDILQTLYEKQTGDSASRGFTPDIFSKCNTILHEETFGLEYVAAIAYIKAFFSSLMRLNLLDLDSIIDEWKKNAIVLKERKDSFVNVMILSVLLKTLLSSRTVCQIKSVTDNEADINMFLKPGIWNTEYLKICFERNPFCLLIGTTLNKNWSHYKENEIQTIKTLISTENDRDLLTLFSLVAMDFYFPKLLEPLVDTNRTRATLIINECSRENRKGTNIIKLLIGESDFKVSVFNINEKTSHREYCMVSFFVTVYLMLLAKNEFIKEINRSLLMECLVSPKSVSNLFLPGFSDTRCGTKETSRTFARVCSCGYRRAVVRHSQSESRDSCSSCHQTPQVNHAALLLCSCGYRSVYVNDLLKKVINCFICKKESEAKSITYSTCKCGFSTIFDLDTMSEDDKWCFICLDDARPTDKNVPNVGSSQKRKVVWKFSGYEKVEFSVRELHPVTVHILQMLVKGCLLGSFALGFTDIKEIAEIIDMSNLDTVAIVIWTEIEHHWEAISSHLNLNENSLTMFLHAVMRKAKSNFCEKICSFSECDDRRKFEKILDEIIVEHIDNAPGMIITFLREHEKLHSVREGAIETSLFEANDLSKCKRHMQVGCFLFRSRGSPTKEHFLSEFHMQRNKFPFLNLVLRYESYFKVPRHIFNIIQWHMTIINRANYIMRKHDCLETTVVDFIYNSQGQNYKQMNRIFESFQMSWDELRKLLQFHKISEKMGVIHRQSKMKDCMIIGKKSTLYEVLKVLVVFQNDILDKALQMANSCRALRFLLRDNNVSAIPCVQITEAKVDDLITFSLDWNRIHDSGMIYRESHCTLEYGQGDKITYNFSSIEKAVAVLTLAGKSYLLFENSLPNVIFTDERFANYASLKSKLKASIPSQQLTTEIENGIIQTSKDDPRIVEKLLAHLGIMMTLLKKTGKEEGSRSLVDYIAKWRDLLTHDFPKELLPNPKSCVKLCHIVPLSELLEDICSETATDVLDKEFRDPLDQNIENHVVKIVQNKQIFRLLLKAIKLFSHRCLSSKMADPKQPLKSYLSKHSFWPEGSRDGDMVTVSNTEENVFSLLPDFIMVRHVYEVVKAMEIEIQKQESEEKYMKTCESKYSRNRTKVKQKPKQRTPEVC